MNTIKNWNFKVDRDKEETWDIVCRCINLSIKNISKLKRKKSYDPIKLIQLKTTCHKYVFKNISPTVIFMLRTVPLKTMRNIQNK